MFELPPLEERRHLPAYLQPLTILVLTTTLSLSPKRSFRLLFLLTAAVPILAVLPFQTTGAVHRDYSIGCLFGRQTFLAIDFLIMSQPERDFWKVPRSDEEAKEQRLWEEGKWSRQKWWWSAHIWTNPRGIGWSWEVRNTPPKPAVGYPVWKFALKHILRFLWFYLLTDALDIYLHTTPLTHNPPARLLDQSLTLQVVIVWVFWTLSYTELNMWYSVLAAVTTLLGLYSPKDFPPISGCLWDSWTPLTTWGRSTARALGFRKGSNASSYTQLYVAFFISALIHLCGAFFTSRREMGELRYFLSQAAAITAEDVVIAGAKRLGCRSGGWVGRAVGYLWFVSWMSWSSRIWVDKVSGHGLWIPRALPFSVVEGGLEMWRALGV